MKRELLVKPIVLVILDGWGMGATGRNNAISEARTPVFDRMWSSYPHSLLEASGRAVGLPDGQAGNSEAGHLNIGAGRIVEQDAIMISHRINDGSFFRNSAFLEAIDHVKKNQSRMHLVGLLTGEQSAHAYPEHLVALLQMLAGYHVHDVFLHLITDGRDSSPHSAIEFLQKLEKHFKGKEKIATIMGRFYAMDRVKEWGRTRQAYDAMLSGRGFHATSAAEAIMQAYNRGEGDEYIRPMVITDGAGKPLPRIDNNDSIIFFNIRSDRVREISKAFVQQDEFIGFTRSKVLQNVVFVSLTDFGPDLPHVRPAYPFRKIDNTLPFVFGPYRQLYVTETEKQAHVTYFFNGGHPESSVAGEDRVIVKSPRLYSYAKKPEMNAREITDVVISALDHDRYDFIVVNYPNADMVGHTGNIKAAIQGIEYVDECLGKIETFVRKRKGIMFVTADHGNADIMLNLETGGIDTEHSVNPVPFIVVGEATKSLHLRRTGALYHIAPTILTIVGLPRPKEMSRVSLCTKSRVQ